MPGGVKKENAVVKFHSPSSISKKKRKRKEKKRSHNIFDEFLYPRGSEHDHQRHNGPQWRRWRDSRDLLLKIEEKKRKQYSEKPFPSHESSFR